MPTRGPLAAVVVAFSLLTLACGSSIEIGGMTEEGVDFSKYHTFGFRKDRQLGEEYRQKLAERTIADILGPKGFRYDPERPDLLVGLTPFADPAMSGDNVPAGMLTWTPWGMPVGASISSGGNVSVAADLTLTFQDAQSGHIVWRGMAKGRADVSNPKETSERVVKAINMLLAGFPPKSK